MESKEVATKESKGTALAMPSGAWGTEEASLADKKVSYLVIAQGDSEIISSGKAKPGDIWDTEGKKTLVTQGKPLELIAFTFKKFWRSDYEEAGLWKKAEMVPYIKGQPPKWKKEQEWRKDEWFADGKKYKGYLVITLLCVPAADPSAFPYVLQLKKGSLFTAGKAAASYAADCAAKGQPLASYTLKLISSTKVNPQNGKKYFAFDLEVGRATTPEEMEIAYKWFQATNTKPVPVDSPEDTSFEPETF